MSISTAIKVTILNLRIMWAESRCSDALEEIKEYEALGWYGHDQYEQRRIDVQRYTQLINHLRLRVVLHQFCAGPSAGSGGCRGDCSQGRAECKTPDLCKATGPLFYRVLAAAAAGFLALAILPRTFP